MESDDGFGVGVDVLIGVGVGVGEDGVVAMLAVIVPGPVTVMLVNLFIALSMVMLVTLLDQEENEAVELGVTDIAYDPASSQTLPNGLIVAYPEGLTTNVTKY